MGKRLRGKGKNLFPRSEYCELNAQQLIPIASITRRQLAICADARRLANASQTQQRCALRAPRFANAIASTDDMTKQMKLGAAQHRGQSSSSVNRQRWSVLHSIRFWRSLIIVFKSGRPVRASRQSAQISYSASTIQPITGSLVAA